ncbi:MAG: chromosomal replication initiator protein DnaA [Planctomycetes bacterium]|nr:chromosomal replication initiator protein DnaA [Planctomycetota bacterium]
MPDVPAATPTILGPPARTLFALAEESPPGDWRERLVDALRAEVSPSRYQHWFEGKTSLRLEENVLHVSATSGFLAGWMQTQFGRAFRKAATMVVGPLVQVQFGIGQWPSAAEDGGSRMEDSRPCAAPSSPSSILHPPSSRPDASASTPRPQPARAAEPAPKGRRLFADLAEFVEGDANRMALTAMREIAEAPGERYNPVYLYGGVGLGKTHLLEGLYRRYRRSFPSLNVLYLTAEAFGNAFSGALAERTTPAFRQRFRAVDVLLVDDVEFLDGKQRFQSEFLHTIQQIERAGRQIVVTADRHPKLLTKTTEELSSRFMSGLVCRLDAPDLQTRRQILEGRLRRAPADIAPEALDFIARRFSGNVRELEGALNVLRTWHSMSKRRVNLAAARQAVSELERDCVRAVRAADIERIVCEFFGVEPAGLKSSKRARAVAQPRMLAMYLMRKLTGAAYSEIGRYFGGRNHATVIAAERRIRQQIETRTETRVAAQSWTFDELVAAVEQRVKAG